MTPYCVTAGDITQEDLDLWERVVDIVNVLPDGLDCHQVCAEIVQKVPDLEVVRGHFFHAQHSWLRVKNRPKILIDAYPWATGTGPFMVTIEGLMNPWRRAYEESVSITDEATLRYKLFRSGEMDL
jgi:hypothetical protein